MITKDTLSKAFDKNLERYLAEWKEYLAFQSVSTDPQFEGGCKACAKWLVEKLSKLGFKAELIPTSGKDMVYAERSGDKSKPVVLFYGHYDVQPVDPIELWKSDPFTPELRDGRMYARGAEDNKGQNFYVLKALETLIEQGQLKNTVKILLEGEEECGSKGIAGALPKIKEKIAADILLVCDSGTLNLDLPSITMGLRGLIFLEVALHGAFKDLHSGTHGGLAPNPLAVIAKMITSLHTPDGRIAVPGYYDQLLAPDQEDLKLALTMPFTDEWYVSQTGVLPVAGEQGKSWAERNGFDPTIEVNGIYGGYSGAGVKTIIPSVAYAKITSRIGAGQDPKRCLDLIVKHLEKSVPKSCRMEVTNSSADARALRVSAAAPEIKHATAILSQLGNNCGAVGYIWMGASFPIAADLAEVSGGTPVMVGFGLEEDNIHAPNESFSIEQLKMGYIFAGLYFSNL
jgi:acetylornithine deacetylase/succinyl-diaminopimelate desuccinylase-like protein